MSIPFTKSAKALAWFGIVNGGLTVATPLLLQVSGKQSVPAVAFLFFLGLGIASFVAGLFGLKAKPWAFWLLFAIFLIQCVEYFSESFFFSLIGPLSLKFGWGWNSPLSQLNLNIVAIAVCIFASRAATQIMNRAGERNA